MNLNLYVHIPQLPRHRGRRALGFDWLGLNRFANLDLFLLFFRFRLIGLRSLGTLFIDYVLDLLRTEGRPQALER